MASLLQVRDAIALNGIAEAHQLSRQLATPLRLVEAMLERLSIMGKIERIEQNDRSCLCGGCKRCPEGQRHHRMMYQLTTPR
ncbi:FeoC-like transcriptional regulator [Candidatus Fukatsuia symbiotica]|uniref:Probable [Fe-S]-dependent transcriptional repressor n=1 Tax=Candidatus Fukatsuia symbiotica TaxID=1878942 RepID=A0A2U8I703_9GAMM|nr:FeoC-like transcriptional regulator [Candidatus Fukatsuia symbiotica]AWK13955.1 ferrous iron transporter C [Candidatus Fukatsuia symbiotica]MEA9445702.1 FeoC-like transcriptional regulator [Candidatus Fukatsuia symbiotica]